MEVLVEDHFHAAHGSLAGKRHRGDRTGIGEFISLSIVNAVSVHAVDLFQFQTFFSGGEVYGHADVDGRSKCQSSDALHPEPKHGERRLLLRGVAERLRGLDVQRLAKGFDFFNYTLSFFQSDHGIVPNKTARTKTHREQTKSGDFGQLLPVPLLSHLPEDLRSERKQRVEWRQTWNLPHLYQHFHLGGGEFLLRLGEGELDLRITG